MRQFFIRLVIGIIWIVAAAVSLFSSNYTSMIMYLVLGIVFLVFAGIALKKEKNKNSEK